MSPHNKASMKYAPPESSRIHELVVQLYAGNWNASVQKAHTLVAVTEASSIVEELTRSAGWRERVVAAKIAHAFELSKLVGPLVQTFGANPETYTASAFARLLASFESSDKDSLLSKLREACPATPYGNHLLELIEKASISEPAA